MSSRGAACGSATMARSQLRRPQLLLNLSVPALAARAATLPADGVGLLRAEFLALGAGRHPRAILEADGEEAYVGLCRAGSERVAGASHQPPVTCRPCPMKATGSRAAEAGESFAPAEATP